MAYVVTEACIKCVYMECVEVCPTHAFHAGDNFVVIDPAACANCGLCEMVCPVAAIYPQWSLPPQQASYAKLNEELSATWPVIIQKGTVPPDADQWAAVSDKAHLLTKS